MSNRCASTWCYVTISNVANKYCDFCKCPFQDCLNSILTCKIHRCKYQNCKDFIKDSTTSYCVRHKCLKMNCDGHLKCKLHVCMNSNCLSFKTENSDYCKYDTCLITGCYEFRMTCQHSCSLPLCFHIKQKNQEYCHRHKCLLCEKSKYTCEEHRCQKCKKNPTFFNDVLCCYDCKCDNCHSPSIQRKKCDKHIQRCIKKGCFEIASQYDLHFKKFLFCKTHGRCFICKYKPREFGRKICRRHTNYFETYPIQLDERVKEIYYPEKFKQFMQTIRIKEQSLVFRNKNMTEYDETVLFVASILPNDLFIELYNNITI